MGYMDEIEVASARVNKNFSGRTIDHAMSTCEDRDLCGKALEGAGHGGSSFRSATVLDTRIAWISCVLH